MKQIFLYIFLLISFGLSAQRQLPFYNTAAGTLTQTGAGSGYVDVRINYSDQTGMTTGSGLDNTCVLLFFNTDDNIGYELPVLSVTTPSSTSPVVRVNITGFPALNGSINGQGVIYKKTSSKHFAPFVSNASGSLQQVIQEAMARDLNDVFTSGVDITKYVGSGVPAFTPTGNEPRLAQGLSSPYPFYAYNGSAWALVGSGGGGSTSQAINGLTKTGDTIKLGGALTQPTTITTTLANPLIIPLPNRYTRLDGFMQEGRVIVTSNDSLYKVSSYAFLSPHDTSRVDAVITPIASRFYVDSLSKTVDTIYFNNIIENIPPITSFTNYRGLVKDAAATVAASVANGGAVSVTSTGASSYTQGITPVRYFKKGYIRVLVKAGTFPLLRIDDNTTSGTAFSVWKSSGNNIEIGKTGTSNTSTSFISPLSIETVAKDFIIEVKYDGNTAGKIAEVRLWNPIDQTRPLGLTGNTATYYAYTFTGTEGLTNGGKIGLNSSSTSIAATYADVNISDNNSKLRGIAKFNGFYYDDMTTTRNIALSTINQGSSIHFNVNSGTYATVKYHVKTGVTPLPILSVILNDGKSKEYTLATGDNSITIPLISGVSNRVQVYIKGIHEALLKFTTEQGVSFTDIVSNGVIAKPIEKKKKIAFFGDSITEGDLGDGGGSSPSTSLGNYCYGNVFGKLTDAEVYIHGYGGTGIQRVGSGLMPSADSNSTFFTSGKSIYGMPSFDAIYINYGTNDTCTSASFQSNYNTFLATLKGLYFIKPTLLIPLANSYRSDIIAVAAANGLSYIDLNAFTGIAYQDGVHPTTDGHFNIALQLAKATAISTSNQAGWNLTGNSGTTAGTNFVGTTDNIDLVFKVNATEKLRLKTAGDLLLNTITVGRGVNNGTLNTVIGKEALLVSTGNINTAVGYESLKANSTGQQNTAIGANSLILNTTGGFNDAHGVNALAALTTGFNNVGIGAYSLQRLVTNSNNSAVGGFALNNTTGSNNSAVGFEALKLNTTGSSNAAIGYQAGYSSTIGMQNVFLGASAGYQIKTGSYNTILGYPTTTPIISLTKDSSLNNTVVIAAGTSIRIYSDSTKNTGINTNTPQYKLDIDANTGGTGNPLRLQGLQAGLTSDSIITSASGVLKRLSITQITNGTSATVTNPTSGNVIGYTAGTNKLYISSGGTLADLTVTFPTSPTDGQEFRVYAIGQTYSLANVIVTNIGFTGGTINSASETPATFTFTAGDCIKYVYHAASATWVRERL